MIDKENNMSTEMNKGVQRRILLKAAKMSGMSDCVVWTEKGLEELSHYNYSLYQDVAGGPIAFIAGGLSVLHKVNGPCYEEV